MHRELADSSNQMKTPAAATDLSPLTEVDIARIYRVLKRIEHSGLREFCVTGSLALYTHGLAQGQRSITRVPNDVDIVVSAFDAVPDALAGAFLVRHIHPEAPSGKIVVQLVDEDDRMRIDVFSACGGTLARAKSQASPFGVIQVVSIGDLASRSARLVLDLARGQPLARKHAEDFHWLEPWADPDRVEIAWRDHRRRDDPLTFAEARGRAQALIDSCEDLLVIPEYSQDADAICLRCREVGSWRLAPALTVNSILGYV